MFFDWPDWVLWIFRSIRFISRKRRSRNWPATTCTVQACTVARGRAGRFSSASHYRSIFGYIFNTDRGPRFVGFFALGTETEDEARDLQKLAQGITLTTRYDPKNPDVSVLVEEAVLGHAVIQNPHWLAYP